MVFLRWTFKMLVYLGLIAVGDEVIEVNNINVEGKTPNDVLKILQVQD